jgi:CheY-like chemotaxis protein
MRGKIGVDSETGKGAIFHFDIPAAVLPPDAASVELRHGRRVIGLAPGQPRHRLLIVEDQPDNRLLLGKLLAPLGFELREATNGEEAISVFERWRPDLIWMDIRMPVMDGLEATRRIKATDAGSRTRIIAVTAHALEEERREILAAGCDDFIRKPYRNADIYDALKRNLDIHFVYDKASPFANGKLPLNAADLAELPVELLKEMEQALVRLDSDEVTRVIDTMRARHPSKMEALGRMAKDLQFGRMLRLVRAAYGQTGPQTGHA